MLKRSGVAKLGRIRDARRALIKSLVYELFKHGAIETSEARAKALRGVVDRVVNKVRRGDLASLREVTGFWGGGRDLANFLTKTCAKIVSGTSGFTRATRLGTRVGDSSSRVKIELIFKPQPTHEATAGTAEGQKQGKSKK